MTAIDELLKAPPEKQRAVLAALPDDARIALGLRLRERYDNPWLNYADDPVGFVTRGLKEHVWSKQVQILESVRDNKRTAVPACHAPGKSHIAARAVAWWLTSHPAGTARAVTTASSFRQVKNILWAHIKRLHMQHNLVGEVYTTNWKIDDLVAGDGFSPADHNETAVQGIHAENLLVVVDEAGGISPTIGQALEALMTGGHTRMLVLGNPPTNNIGSWFERACNSPLYNVIPIDAYSTPNFTGEINGPWVKNLVDREWVQDVVREFGEDSAFVQARVHARFPRVTTNVVIPIDWLESATPTESVTPQGVIRLGVDVAADGGDEFVIARMDGMTASIAHTSTNNSNAVEVAGTILAQVHRAEADHNTRGIAQPVIVKIDAIGVGWGVASLLSEWGKEGKHTSIIRAVNVAEKAHDPVKFLNQRAEMWWNLRQLLQPDANGEQTVTLNLDHRTIAQLTAPTYKSSSSGRLQIESKADMRKRGIHSPDRAEAVLLAAFEPPSKTVPLVAPIGIPQKNEWI